MRSDRLTQGPVAAPQRAILKALGLSDAEIARPLIGIVSSQNDIVQGTCSGQDHRGREPGGRHGRRHADRLPAIAVCDGLAMGHVGMKYSLVSRGVDRRQRGDDGDGASVRGLVLVAACDKNVPGLLMAAGRLNVPTIVISAGAMLAGRMTSGRRLSYSDVAEAVGAFHAGRITKTIFMEIEDKCCPSCGSCSGMFTANSMNCLTEVLGMALPGNGTIPAVMSARLRLAKDSGMRVMDLVRENVRPRDLMTREAFENALAVDMALGCSTNSMLHLPAIAHECGIELDLTVANEISKRPRTSAISRRPAKPTSRTSTARAGFRGVLGTLLPLGVLHEARRPSRAARSARSRGGRSSPTAKTIRPLENPWGKEGGIAVLKGNLAPEGAVVKRSAVDAKMMVHTGPARVFDDEEAAIAAIHGREDPPGRRRGDPVRRPEGRSRMREMLNPTAAIVGGGARGHRRPHHRRALLGRDPRGRDRARLAGSRRRRADRVRRRGRHDHGRHPGERLDGGGGGGRHGRPPRPLVKPEPKIKTGVLARYAKLVSSGMSGAVLK